jgi:hypothetical protein
MLRGLVLHWATLARRAGWPQSGITWIQGAPGIPGCRGGPNEVLCGETPQMVGCGATTLNVVV